MVRTSRLGTKFDKYERRLTYGMLAQKPECTLVVDSGSVFLDVSAHKGGDIDFFFDNEIYTLDCTNGGGVDGAARIEIPQGTATSILKTFVYLGLDEGEPALFVAFTEPTGQEVLVAIIGITTAAQVSGGFVPIFHKASVSLSYDKRSAITWARDRLRSMPVTWESGCDPSLEITSNAGSEDDVDLSITAGLLFQMSKLQFPSRQVSVDGIHVYNVSGDGTLVNFQKITNLNEIHEDGNGTALVDGDCIVLTIGASVNSEAEDCLFFAALPKGIYTDEDEARLDSNKYAWDRIPEVFRNTGFFICKLVLKYNTADNGTWTNVLTEPVKVWRTQAEDESSPNYPSNYPNDTDQDVVFSVTGAESVRLVFDDFVTEAGYDFVRLSDGSDVLQVTYAGELGQFTSQEIDGDTIKLNFTSDGSVVARGWHVNGIQYSELVASGCCYIDLRGILPGWSL